jgi:hypothetical protein
VDARDKRGHDDFMMAADSDEGASHPASFPDVQLHVVACATWRRPGMTD